MTQFLNYGLYLLIIILIYKVAIYENQFNFLKESIALTKNLSYYLIKQGYFLRLSARIYDIFAIVRLKVS